MEIKHITTKRLTWFEGRVGKYIYKRATNLFSPPIKIESKQHAKALYINQTKGYRYYE